MSKGVKIYTIAFIDLVFEVPLELVNGLIRFVNKVL